MDSNIKEKIAKNFDEELNKQLLNSLEKESDRAKLILIISWIDDFIGLKLKNEFSKGNSKARKSLFSSNGPFATFNSKLNFAFCAGWIDSDVYHDIQIIRKLRNECAHSIESISLNAERFRKEIDKLRVPRRQFSDWGKTELWVVSKDNKITISDGKKPDNATSKLKFYMSGDMTLTTALPVIITVLICNLKIPFFVEENNKKIIFALDLPGYMKEF